jgi:2-keto-4-pentenoate hydratase/2-oxohepta-3-ene-1,7-dioic acid hydratase in catechol pathway
MNSIKIDSANFTPSKIVCVGRNYLEHIQELDNETPEEMVIFNKPNSSISQTLCAERDAEPLHYEGEICFMLQDNALHGIGFGLDLTRRELQSKLKSKGLPWERAKAFDGAACLQLEVDGKLRQDGGYELMMHKPDQILAGIQAFMTLEDGDIIMTGTPKGVGQVKAGERFVGRILSAGRELVSREWRVE